MSLEINVHLHNFLIYENLVLPDFNINFTEFSGINGIFELNIHLESKVA